MQNVCLVTMQEVWTPEANNGLLYKPHLQFLAQNLNKKVWLIDKSLQQYKCMFSTFTLYNTYRGQ